MIMNNALPNFETLRIQDAQTSQSKHFLIGVLIEGLYSSYCILQVINFMFEVCKNCQKMHLGNLSQSVSWSIRYRVSLFSRLYKHNLPECTS